MSLEHDIFTHVEKRKHCCTWARYILAVACFIEWASFVCCNALCDNPVCYYQCSIKLTSQRYWDLLQWSLPPEREWSWMHFQSGLKRTHCWEVWWRESMTVNRKRRTLCNSSTVKGQLYVFNLAHNVQLCFVEYLLQTYRRNQMQHQASETFMTNGTSFFLRIIRLIQPRTSGQIQFALCPLFWKTKSGTEILILRSLWLHVLQTGVTD